MTVVLGRHAASRGTQAGQPWGSGLTVLFSAFRAPPGNLPVGTCTKSGSARGEGRTSAVLSGGPRVPSPQRLQAPQEPPDRAELSATRPAPCAGPQPGQHPQAAGSGDCDPGRSASSGAAGVAWLAFTTSVSGGLVRCFPRKYYMGRSPAGEATLLATSVNRSNGNMPVTKPSEPPSNSYPCSERGCGILPDLQAPERCQQCSVDLVMGSRLRRPLVPETEPGPPAC